MSAATEAAAINRELIYAALPGTTKQLRVKTGLTQATIDVHRKKMQADGVVMGTKIMRPDSRGRPQIMYTLTGKPLTAHIDKQTTARQQARSQSASRLTQHFFGAAA